MTRRFGMGSGARGDEPVDLKFVRVEMETDAAWLVVFDSGSKNDGHRVQEWMPKSQCSIDEDAETVAAPRWLVERIYRRKS